MYGQILFLYAFFILFNNSILIIDEKSIELIPITENSMQVKKILWQPYYVL